MHTVTVLADLAASSPASILAAVFSGVCVVGLAFAGRSLLRAAFILRDLRNAMFPHGKDPLPDQVESIRDDVRDLRKNGSERLAEILGEARQARRGTGAPPPPAEPRPNPGR